METLARRREDTPMRVALGSESVRRSQLDATTEKRPLVVEAMLAAEPRTTPAIVRRASDTVVVLDEPVIPLTKRKLAVSWQAVDFAERRLTDAIAPLRVGSTPATPLRAANRRQRAKLKKLTA